MRDYTLYLQDILDAIIAIEKFVDNMTFEQFDNDDKTVSAVLKKLEIVGEASKNIPQKITQKYADMPWFRDRLVHSHFGTDYKIVWEVIHQHLPPLKPKLKQILLQEQITF